MKIKAKKSFKRQHPQSIPCDVKTRRKLMKGETVNIKDATEMLAMNIVQEVKTKKGSK